MDESFLDTGQNSASMSTALARKLAAKRAKEAQDAEKASNTLTPAGKQLIELCEAEKASIYDMRAIMIDPKMTDEQVKVEREARKLHEYFVKQFEGKVKQILKDNKVK